MSSSTFPIAGYGLDLKSPEFINDLAPLVRLTSDQVEEKIDDLSEIADCDGSAAVRINANSTFLKKMQQLEYKGLDPSIVFPSNIDPLYLLFADQTKSTVTTDGQSIVQETISTTDANHILAIIIANYFEIYDTEIYDATTIDTIEELITTIATSINDVDFG